MSQPLTEQACRDLFLDARTHHAWQSKPVSDETLRELYDRLKWGPTSANCTPMRMLFLRTPEAKERLRPALMAGNVAQTMAAPVTAIIAYDELFYNQLPTLFPHSPSMRDMFAQSLDLANTTAFRNGTLQGGYFILAARSVGLDCGPMSGFDNAKVDAEFFNSEADAKSPIMAVGRIKSNFLCNLGYGDSAKLHPRGPRLTFDEVCRII